MMVPSYIGHVRRPLINIQVQQYLFDYCICLCFHKQNYYIILYLNCNCCSQFAYHHVITQITVSHFVSNTFFSIMKNSNPLHPLWPGQRALNALLAILVKNEEH